MTQTLEQIIARWDANEGKPYKGKLIDWRSYDGDGDEQPTNIGCMCAQGQVLHLMGGWTPQRLKDVEQSEADKATAKLLGISVAHSILLRSVNDNADGAPSIVLTHPEKILGDQTHIVLAFWRHLDRMTDKDWDAAGAAARAAAWAIAGAAAGDATGAAARAAAWAIAGAAAGDAAWDVAWGAARAAARAAAGDVAWGAAWGAAGACSEIQGAHRMRERGKPFFFLPVFGFADPEAVLVADVQS